MIIINLNNKNKIINNYYYDFFEIKTEKWVKWTHGLTSEE
jgi:hypothetical protein